MQRQLLLIIIMMLFAFCGKAQHDIAGIILTKDGSPAAYVNIDIRALKKITVSDSSGKFHFDNIPAGKFSVMVSFAGLQTQQHTIIVPSSGNTEVNFILAENAMQLTEVIVTARKNLNTEPLSLGKLSINPMDLPQSISVIGQTVLRDQQSQRLSDVVKNVNGVYLSTTRGSTQESFSARGYAFSGTNLFKNGSRVNSGVMPEMSSLEKVEILKGSAAILYGNVAPGGIINMVSKQPKFSTGGEFSLRAGSYGLFKPAVDFYAPLSKNIAYRINGTYEKAGSYRDLVESERFYINPSMLFKLGSKTELLLQADYLQHHFTPDFGIGTLAGTIIPNLPRNSFLGTTWQYNKAKQTTATATLKQQLSRNWTLNISGSFQQYKRDYYATERIQAAADGDWSRPLNKIQSQENYFIGEANLTGKIKTGRISHQLLAGIDADNYHTTTYSFNNPTTYDKINILDPNKYQPRTDIPAAIKLTRIETPVNRVGAYVQDLISLSEKFKVLTGLRFSQQKSPSATTTFLLKDSSSKSIAKNDKAFSPRLGVVYQPAKTTSVFASYANSFSINSGTDIYGASLAASLIDQYEIGIKNEFFQGKLSANLTLYKIINNNLAQTARYDKDGRENNNTALKELVGQTKSNGVEIDVSSQPVKGLHVLAGYSYNDMRYTKTKAAPGNYYEGDRLVNTPAHTANSSLFYSMQKGKWKGVKFGVGFYYTGARFGGWNTTQPAPNTAVLYRLIPVKDFMTIDISAGYTIKKFSFLAKVSNLFNIYNYYVHENYSVNPIAPRQFIATFSYKL
ncbi:MAG: TonB-dependent receptor [Ferruginibacter sp.]|nr:TonB-dependent receptor [Ferruginibacter sp.]